MVMEKAKGVALRDLFTKPGLQVSLSQKWQIIRDLASAVGYLHSRNICHRDLTPNNIIVQLKNSPGLEAIPKVTIIDFNISRRLAEIDFLDTSGTANYRSPEALLGEPQGLAGDMWSLGAVLFFILSNGKEAFVASHPKLRELILKSMVDFSLLKNDQYTISSEF